MDKFQIEREGKKQGSFFILGALAKESLTQE